MTEKLNIVQSTTEPDKRNIWLKDNELKKFGAKGWSTIGGSNAGGGDGTSTDKDILYIYIDFDTHSIIVNDKTYATIRQNSDMNIVVGSEELYNILYTSLFNTYKTVYITTIPTSSDYLFFEASIIIVPKDRFISLASTVGDVLFKITIINQ